MSVADEADEIVYDIELTLEEIQAVVKALSISVDKLASKLASTTPNWRGRAEGVEELRALTSALDEIRAEYHTILAA
jgi:predicted  nucleic acid-binding Zn-ribbon protein